MLKNCFRKNKNKNVNKIKEQVQPLTKITFKINGTQYDVSPSEHLPITTSLNTFIREHALLPGTKFMCLEGGCGACIVSIRRINANTKNLPTLAVNSCLFPLFSCQDLEVTTIEGIGNKKDGYNKLQKVLADNNGSQCGFCSPGMVMNMYSLMESKKNVVTKSEVENSFSGNVCRCTGYRPILFAFKSMAVDDIEDLGKPCFRPCIKNVSQKLPVQLVDLEGKKWFKPYNIPEIFDIFKQLNADDQYILIHGNTSKGAYPDQADYKVFIDITNVVELHQTFIGEELILGANTTLTDAIDFLKTAATHSSFGYCQQLATHIDLIANVPVQNTGSLAGNLIIKHEHNEFPSDIFVLLESVGAHLEIIDSNDLVVRVKPSNFLNVNMNKKIITKIILPSLSTAEFIFQSYKIMPIAQNAIAYVTAAFLLNVSEENIIKNATVVFGGINSQFTHAEKTEAFLTNKSLSEPSTLQPAFSILSSELTPDWVLPDSSPAYRKNLAISLLYKLLLSITSHSSTRYTSGGQLLVRPLSSGQENFQTIPSKWPVTQNVPKIEGLLQCSGEAQYSNDIAPQPDELWAAFVVATEVDATIEGFDDSDALSYPGVTHFFSAKDIPGDNNFTPLDMFAIVEPEEVFCSEKVLFYGQPVGILLASSMEAANKAAGLVKIKYQKTSKSVRLCNAEKTIDMTHLSDSIEIQGHFECGAQYHFSLETQTCVVIPSDLGLEVYAATQSITLNQMAIAKCLKLPVNSVNIQVKRVGGAYGSKISRSSQIACATALGAHLTNRPVRHVLEISRNMESIGKRFPFKSNYAVTIDENGKILKASNDITYEFGCGLNEDYSFLAEPVITNCYSLQNFKYKINKVLTGAPKNTWCRAPGSLEAIAMMENTIEHIAKVIKKDPIQVRLRNIADDNPIKKIFSDFLSSTEFYKRKGDTAAFNTANRWRKRGIACIPMQWALNYIGTFHAVISVYQGDGTVSIAHGGVEVGQGINTKAAQVAASTLGIPLKFIKIEPTTSLTAPNDFSTAGNFTGDFVCFAIIEACKILKTRLKLYIAKSPTWKQAVRTAYAENINLQATFMSKPTDMSPYKIYGVAVAEVEVDLLTGNYFFSRVDLLEDVGDSISPGIDIGQIEGAFVMGMGYWLMESLIYDNTNGKLLTNRTFTYHVPMAKDIPVDFRVNFLSSRPKPAGSVLGSKATGEPAICMAIVCLFALKNALYDARKDAGLPDEYFALDLPATPENVFLAAGNKLEDYKF